MTPTAFLPSNRIYQGDARALLQRVRPESVALSFWSPPYFVGKSYEAGLDFAAWCDLLADTIAGHFPAIAPGGFLAVNIADILAFEDPAMPRIQADNVSAKKVKITREQVLAAQRANPGFDKYQLAALLGCSEQTIDRRLKHNNVRGGKYAPQTRVKLTAGMVEQWAADAGFYLYDRRAWVKDPCWENSRWHSLSYRSVDEWEHLLIFWKPGITVVNRERLDAGEWAEWGSRSVWQIPSVRANTAHESQFPIELPRRMIRLLTEPDDLVLDCFVGSGTTALAAIEQGRRFMGFDLNPASVRLAEKLVAVRQDMMSQTQPESESPLPTQEQPKTAYDLLGQADAAFAAGDEMQGAQRLWDAFVAMIDYISRKRGLPPCRDDDDILRLLQELVTPERDYYSHLLRFYMAERFRKAVQRGAMEDYEVEIFGPEVHRIINELAEVA